MSQKPNNPNGSDELRRRAEARLRNQRRGQPSKQVAANSATDAKRALHELEVHQIELEMQNEELAEARNRMELLLQQYTDLYDFAPTGYFTLDSAGTICRLNLAGASVLGAERARLVGLRFDHFIAPEVRPTFDTFLRQAFASGSKETYETSIQRAGQPLKWVWVEACGDATRQECRLAVVDITRRKLAEADRTRLERQVFAASEREQRRIGERLHEDICQRLTGLGAAATAIAQALGKKVRPESGLAGAIACELKKTCEETHRFANTLQPVPLLDQGFLAALENLLQHIQARSGVHCIFKGKALPEIAAADATHLYRIVQEALDNCVRHARASQISLSVSSGDRGFTLTIVDDGSGMVEPPAHESGLGLPMMHYRSQLIGAELKIKSKPGRGTIVTCSYLSAPRMAEESARRGDI